MFTANTAFQFGTDRAAFFYGHFDQLSYTILVEYLERVYLQDLLFQIYRQEGSNVIA